MKLTKEQAIDYSIELWEWLAETGKYKEDWPEWGKFGKVDSHCFLCGYDTYSQAMLKDEADDCICPYNDKFGGCADEDTPFQLWCSAETIKERKKYAKLFLEQLRSLK